MNFIELVMNPLVAETFLEILPTLNLPILFGDVDDWVKIIVFLFFILGPILNAIGGAKAKNPGPQKRPVRIPPVHPGQRRPAIPPQQQVGKPPQQPGQGRRALENEIEEFLKRAGQGRRQRPQAGDREKALPRQPAKEAPRVSLEQRRLNKEAAQRQAEKKLEQQAAASRRKAKQQEAAKAQQRKPLRQSVGDHVREHIESHPVSDHGRSLGKQIGQSDERVEQHLHDVFDHKLGSLTKNQIFEDSEGTDASVWERRVTVSPATKIREMLKSPDSIRNAIVLTEVFKRPVGLDE